MTTPTKEVAIRGIYSTPRNLRLNKKARESIILARREKVAEYLMLGYSEAKIAKELGVTPSLIHYDILAVRGEWQQSTVDSVLDAALLDLARLDFIIAGLLPRIPLGDVKAGDVAIRAIGHRATILGYNRGVQMDMESYIREMALQNGFDPDRAHEIAMKVSLTMKTISAGNG
jgi:hypothetical protein